MCAACAPGTGIAGTAVVRGHSHVPCTHTGRTPHRQHTCARTRACTHTSGRAQGQGRHWSPRTPAPHLVQFGLDLDHICLHLVDSRPAMGRGRPGSDCSQLPRPRVRQAGPSPPQAPPDGAAGPGLLAAVGCPAAPRPSDRPGNGSWERPPPGRRRQDRDPDPADSRAAQSHTTPGRKRPCPM